MRVALVCPYSLNHPGGVATHVLGLALWLREAGVDAHVLAPGTGKVDAGVPVTLLGGAVRLPFNGSVAELAVGPAQARRAAELARGFDLVHVHEPLTPGVGFAAARAARRLVVTHHAAFTPRAPLTSLLRARARRLPGRVTLAVSDEAARLARAATGLTPEIVPNAITLPSFPAPGPRTDVVFLGRLGEPRKGYDVFRKLPPLLPGVRLVAVGDGATGSPGIEELGRLDAAALSDVLGRAAVLVAPNRFGESFGMVLIEALAHGAAVVASDLPAFRAVIEDEAVAGFFPVGDAQAAAALVRERLDRPADPAAARAAVERYGWDAVGPRVLSAYRRASH